MGRPVLIIDVGGGSTEFILGVDGRLVFRESFKLGSVRLHERFPPSDPPGPGELPQLRAWLDAFLAEAVVPGLGAAMERTSHPERVVGVGGTTAILALMEAGTGTFDRALVESAQFGHVRLSAILDVLWSEPLAARRTRPGLPPERADVILFGVAI